MKKGSPQDPKGLIAEAYRIDGITPAECRSIFLDWALSLPDGMDASTAIKTLLAQYGTAGHPTGHPSGHPSGHPMTDVLTEGLAGQSRKGRRGGRAARHPQS